MFAACSAVGPRSTDGTSPLASSATPTASASADAAVVVEPSGRTIVRIGSAKAAPFGESLLPVADAETVFEVWSFADERLGYAALTGVNGPVGPTIELVDEYPVYAYADGDRTTLMVSAADALCPITIADGKVSRGTCFDQPGDTLLRIDGKLALLDVHPKVDDDEKKPSPPKKPPAAKKPPPKKGPAKKPKIPSEAQIKKRLFSSGKEVVVDGYFLGEAGASDRIETGLSFKEAMAGMGFIGAGSRNQRVDVAFYEFNDKQTKEAEGKLGYAQLDAALVLDPPTKRSFGESKLNPGFLSDHADMRLVTLPEGSLLLGHRGPRGKCDVTFVGPFLMQLIPDHKACAIDAQRLVRTARAIHKAQPTDTIAATPALDLTKTRRVVGQSSLDMGRTAYAGARAFAYEGTRLVSFVEGEAPVEIKRALEVERRRVLFGAWDREGRALIETDEGLFELSGETLVTTKEQPVTTRLGRGRADVAREIANPAVRIGDAWWQAEGELRRLHPDVGEATRELARGTDLVVGGRTRGLLVENRGAVLDVSAIKTDGVLEPLGHHAVALGPRGLGIERQAGGAILIAPNATHTSLDIVVLDDRGAMLAPQRVDQGLDATATLLASPLPSGGAIVHPSTLAWALWLDDDGKPLSTAPWQQVSSARCADGVPRPNTLPAPKPGTFVELGVTDNEPDGRRHCMICSFQWLASGQSRWVSSRMDGAALRPEVTLSEIFNEAISLHTPPAVPPSVAARAPTAGRTSRCPGEMVLVGTELCVDRFEGTLTDPSGVFVSPDYAATPDLFAFTLGEWATRRERGGDLHARAFPLPSIGVGERTKETMRAATLAGVRPSGFVTGKLAKQACEHVGKRLCTTLEWQRACRGDADTMFPYGKTYEAERCNSRTTIHPAATLHDHAGMGHHDPRLNRVTDAGAPLLRETASLPGCASRWGDDAIFDMVGNLDEWVDEKGGAFAGGFYARGSVSGCEALITVHPPPYSDYSTGIRCCKSSTP